MHEVYCTLMSQIDFFPQKKHLQVFVSFFHQAPSQDSNDSMHKKESENGPQLVGLEAPFVPPCQVKHKDALSALRRVKSQSCKRLIYKTACLSEAKKLYNLDIKRTCPVPREKGSPAKWIDVANTPYGNPIRIAFVVTLHGRAFRQVRRLFKALYHNNHYFFFHIDSVSYVHSCGNYFLKDNFNTYMDLTNRAVNEAWSWGSPTLVKKIPSGTLVV